MRNLTNRLTLVAAVALLGLAIGCASTKHTEDLLSAAGFKAVPATTAEQEAHLKALPSGKVTMVIRNGKIYYAFPDVPHNMLYIGQTAQYQQIPKAPPRTTDDGGPVERRPDEQRSQLEAIRN